MTGGQGQVLEEDRMNGLEAWFKQAITHPSGSCRHTIYISTKTEFSRKWSTYIVIPRRPARVQLHVKLSLLPGQLVVLGLLFPGQGMPLQRTRGRERKTGRNITNGSTR